MNMNSNYAAPPSIAQRQQPLTTATPPVPPTTPFLGVVDAELTELTSRLMNHTDRLTALLIRLRGEVPTAECASSHAPRGGDGMATLITDRLATLRSEVNRLDAATNELTQIA